MQEDYLTFSFAFDNVGEEGLVPDFRITIPFAYGLEKCLVALGLHHELVNNVYIEQGFADSSHIQAIC